MIPDVIALPLEPAGERLEQAGVSIEIEKTYPTKPAKGNGVWRVVRQAQKGGTVVLLAAEELEGAVS